MAYALSEGLGLQMCIYPVDGPRRCGSRVYIWSSQAMEINEHAHISAGTVDTGTSRGLILVKSCAEDLAAVMGRGSGYPVLVPGL
jgi:hypothetical protein